METHSQNNLHFNEKEFKSQESILVTCHTDKKYELLGNVFTYLIFFKLLKIIGYIFLDSNVNVMQDLENVGKLFKYFHISLLLWIMILVNSLTIFFKVKLWAIVRIKITKKCILPGVWDNLWMLLYVGYNLSILFLGCVFTYKKQGPLTAIIFGSEVLRLLTKQYVFVRSMIPRVLNDELLSGEAKLEFPNFKSYLYFLFAPTLIYRDKYPRTEKIRLLFVYKQIEMLTIIIILAIYLIIKEIVPIFEDFGSTPYTLKTILLVHLKVITSLMILALNFIFIVTHFYQNLVAELLRFADREFYRKWWKSKTYGNFFKNCFTIVNQFFYTFIYQDALKIFQFCPCNKKIAHLIVVFLSGLSIEYVIFMCTGFIYPICLIFFLLVGCILYSFKRKFFATNVRFLCSITIDSVLIFTLVMIEAYVRINCPKEANASLLNELFVPRTWTCPKFSPT